VTVPTVILQRKKVKNKLTTITTTTTQSTKEEEFSIEYNDINSFSNNLFFLSC